MHIPAPKTPLPGHAESYRPPKEYLLTEEEQKQWEVRSHIVPVLATVRSGEWAKARWFDGSDRHVFFGYCSFRSDNDDHCGYVLFATFAVVLLW